MFNYIRICKFSNLQRFYSDIASSKNILEPLLNRSLIRVNGQEVWGYLQGLITNDMGHLSKKDMGSMYTMFLNTKGRIFCEAIIYKFEDSNTYFIECDREVLEPLQKHLKLYRVRRKIEVHNLSNEYKLYSLFNAFIFRPETPDEHKRQWEESILTLDSNVATNIHKDLRIFKDPRVRELGFRVIANSHINVKDEIDDVIKVTDAIEPNECYASLRYSLGVGEGLKEHPIGTSFPLECNCDYLHGVSFHKGCYIGQELTARIHHTGVVRKRLMPLFFSKIPTLLPIENNIIHQKINLGKFRGIKGNVGLALLRVNEALEFQEVTIGDGVAVVKKPSWWPIEASKVKVSAHKNV